MMSSEVNHLQAVVQFILSSGSCLSGIQNKNWQQFARYYNGKYYKRNNYDQKLAHAYNKLISNKKP